MESVLLKLIIIQSEYFVKFGLALVECVIKYQYWSNIDLLTVQNFGMRFLTIQCIAKQELLRGFGKPNNKYRRAI